MKHRRKTVGDAGERIAAWFLQNQGLVLLDRNIRVGGGEIDLVMKDRDQLVAIEVRTRRGSGDPIDAVDPEKRRRVGSLGRKLGVDRVDFTGVALTGEYFDFHWVPGQT